MWLLTTKEFTFTKKLDENNAYKIIGNESHGIKLNFQINDTVFPHHLNADGVESALTNQGASLHNGGYKIKTNSCCPTGS